ncbi:MAG: hypothetical protein ACQES9_01815 [Myxococcota bacterium]
MKIGSRILNRFFRFKTEAGGFRVQLSDFRGIDRKSIITGRRFSIYPISPLENCNFGVLIGKLQNSSLEGVAEILGKYDNLASKAKATAVSIIC